MVATFGQFSANFRFCGALLRKVTRLLSSWLPDSSVTTILTVCWEQLEVKPETVIFLTVTVLEMGAGGLEVGAGAVSLLQLLKMQQKRESRRMQPRVRAMRGLEEVVIRAESVGGWSEEFSGL